MEEIRKKWSTYSSNIKKKDAQNRRDSRKTGGGPPPEDLGSLEDRVVEIIGETSMNGIEGGIDTCISPVDHPRTSSSPMVTPASSESSEEEEGSFSNTACQPEKHKSTKDASQRLIDIEQARLKIETERLQIEKERLKLKGQKIALLTCALNVEQQRIVVEQERLSIDRQRYQAKEQLHLAQL